MKRLWFIPVLLALIIAGSFWSMRATHWANEEMTRITNEIISSAERKDRIGTVQSCEELDAAWQRQSQTLQLFLSRSETKEVSLAISELLGLAKQGEWEECIVKALECQALTRQIKKNESFHIGVFL